jgi:hypothetical protein
MTARRLAVLAAIAFGLELGDHRRDDQGMRLGGVTVCPSTWLPPEFCPCLRHLGAVVARAGI